MNSITSLLVKDIIDRLSGGSVVILCSNKKDAQKKLRVWQDFLYRLKNTPVHFKYYDQEADYVDRVGGVVSKEILNSVE